jgi:hypothetical protein
MVYENTNFYRSIDGVIDQPVGSEPDAIQSPRTFAIAHAESNSCAPNAAGSRTISGNAIAHAATKTSPGSEKFAGSGPA